MSTGTDSRFAASLRGARVVVVGLGRSGVAAAELCRAHGAAVVGTDGAPRERLSAEALALEGRGVKLALGGHDDAGLEAASLVVVSPGVPAFAALRAAEARGVPVIGELELAYRFVPEVPVVAITGSNGKSTTTTLVGELVAALGGKPFVGGNLGTPPSEVVPRPAGPEARGIDTLGFDTLVLEVSSFQAERIPTLAPRRAALLNLSPNHLDRYDGYQAYCDAKGNLFAQQGPGDAAVVPGYEAACVAQAHRGRGAVVTFGPRNGEFAGKYDYTFDREAIVDEARGVAYARRDVRLAGDHNALNVCAALALVADRAPDPEVVREVLARFEGLPHRNVRVAHRRGVTYYDDSKSTSVGASVAAVAGLAEERVVLVAGGRDKQGSYVPLRDALLARGRGLVLIGEAAPLIAATVGDAVPTAHAGSMDDAVALAAAMAQPGDAVLLSPACSSFDMFRDYKERGDRFVAAVLALPE